MTAVVLRADARGCPLRSDPELAARLVPCPLCGAAPGLPCINTTTRRPFTTGTVHRERVPKSPKTPANGTA